MLCCDRGWLPTPKLLWTLSVSRIFNAGMFGVQTLWTRPVNGINAWQAGWADEAQLNWALVERASDSLMGRV